MSTNRFVKARVVKLDISDGDWVEVKEKLSYGETQKLAGAMTPNIKPGNAKDKDTEMGFDWAEYSLQRLAAYIVDWSLTDESGQRVKVSKQAIFALDSDTVKEIDDAIEAYQVGVEEKKVLTLTTKTASKQS